eukprot:CAMPEP_0170393288 /NCGR_PEP_ID=MMETSP0117_2-20130122/20647_1 /TAXON_ID=400756 /ORGANISM="Durinskia baltica, Strain CSIRO CS-38" /LENGTH=171 /DNA_ID=CAMNT_0010649485 /DNA_START=123 /DNA_END=635 /DNA_ORIENTATION=-
MSALNAMSMSLCSVSLAFFIVGCIGYDTKTHTLKAIPWIETSDDGYDVYYGLRSVYAKRSTALGTTSYSVKYSDSDCSADFCDTCGSAGISAFVLVLAAIGFTVSVMSTSSSMDRSRSVHIGNALMAGLGGASALVAISLFMGDCHDKINEETTPDDDTYYGDGPNFDLHW